MRGRFSGLYRKYIMFRPRLVRGQNKLYDYMLWVLGRGELLMPSATCPFCHSRTVTVMSIVSSDGGVSLGSGYTSCDQPGCQYELKALSPTISVQLRPLSWRILSDYHGSDRKNVEKVLDWAFEMPKRLTPERAHEILLLGIIPEEYRPKKKGSS